MSETGHDFECYTSVELGTAEQSLLADNEFTTVNAAMEYAVLTEVCPLTNPMLMLALDTCCSDLHPDNTPLHLHSPIQLAR